MARVGWSKLSPENQERFLRRMEWEGFNVDGHVMVRDEAIEYWSESSYTFGEDGEGINFFTDLDKIKEKEAIDEAKLKLGKDDLYPALYQALNYMGDDFEKSNIIRALENGLDEDAYKTVVAIFQVETEPVDGLV